ncbi:MAG: hypothetical protein WD055_05460 [Candidatus Dependentiae bacterium]
MIKKLLCIVLFGHISLCMHAADLKQIESKNISSLDKSSFFQLLIGNKASGAIEVYTKRVDPLQSVYPVTQEMIAPFQMKSVNFDCPYIIVTFPDRKQMAEINIPVEIKDIYEANQNGKILMTAEFDGDAVKCVFALFINNKLQFSIDSFSEQIQQMLSPEDVKVRIIERCKKYLPAGTVGTHYLSQRKYLRRSDGIIPSQRKILSKSR